MSATPVIRVERATWPADPYGLSHGKATSHLCQQIGESLGLAGDELLLARCVGMFHDLGRVADWWLEDSGHARRSAEAAVFTFQDDPDWLALWPLVERAARVIAQHRITGAPPRDPIAVALWDADILECARFAPGELRGEQLVRTRYARLITPCARGMADGWYQQALRVARQSAPAARQ